MRFKLAPEVYTPQQLSLLIDELKRQLRQHSHETVKAEVGNKPLPGDANATAFDAKAAEVLLGELEELVKSAPRVHLTLAAMPSEGLKRQLADWMRENVSPTVLVEFNYNSALLGGMVVRIGSRIFDWSFRRQILASAGEFTKVLRHV